MKNPKWYIYVAVTLAAGIISVFGALKPQADDFGSSRSPSFVVDPDWPKPLPATVTSDGVAHTWVTGEVGGNCTDQKDNVYTYNRGWEVGVTQNGVLQGNLSGGIVGQDASASAIPSPPVVVYNSDGKVIAGWGNPSLIQSGADYGFARRIAMERSQLTMVSTAVSRRERPCASRKYRSFQSLCSSRMSCWTTG